MTSSVTIDGARVVGEVLGMKLSQFVPAALALLLAACGGNDAATAPVAPSGLSAAALTGGAHLTWSDNSDNETEFMVMRMKAGTDIELLPLTTVPFDTEQYHDAPLTSGGSYTYAIMAMNDAGEAMSNEVTFVAP